VIPIQVHWTVGEGSGLSGPAWSCELRENPNWLRAPTLRTNRRSSLSEPFVILRGLIVLLCLSLGGHFGGPVGSVHPADRCHWGNASAAYYTDRYGGSILDFVGSGSRRLGFGETFDQQDGDASDGGKADGEEQVGFGTG